MLTIPEENFLNTLPKNELDPYAYFPSIVVNYLREKNKLHVLKNRVRSIYYKFYFNLKINS